MEHFRVVLKIELFPVVPVAGRTTPPHLMRTQGLIEADKILLILL